MNFRMINCQRINRHIIGFDNQYGIFIFEKTGYESDLKDDEKFNFCPKCGKKLKEVNELKIEKLVILGKTNEIFLSLKVKDKLLFVEGKTYDSAINDNLKMVE